MGAEPQGRDRQRLDKWLFFARMLKSRSLAQGFIEAGHVTVNDRKVTQPSHNVKVGDRIELRLDRRDVVLIVRSGGERRGPFDEAKRLYEDLSPPPEAQPRLNTFELAQRQPGSGRPTKRERREMERLFPEIGED